MKKVVLKCEACGAKFRFNKDEVTEVFVGSQRNYVIECEYCGTQIVVSNELNSRSHNIIGNGNCIGSGNTVVFNQSGQNVKYQTNITGNCVCAIGDGATILSGIHFGGKKQ